MWCYNNIMVTTITWQEEYYVYCFNKLELVTQA